jgi:hypothetical protein
MQNMDYEMHTLRLPASVDRMTAAVQLAITAEYTGWELARVRLFRDGSRQILLRRRLTDRRQPTLTY